MPVGIWCICLVQNGIGIRAPGDMFGSKVFAGVSSFYQAFVGLLAEGI